MAETAETEEKTTVAAAAEAAERPRNVAYARVWTSKAEPVLVARLSDELYGRGFMPGVSDAGGKGPTLSDAGLADARFEVDGPGFRFVNLSSSKGGGCVVTVRASSPEDRPDDLIARRTVPKPKLCYFVEAGGPAHSDRNLCENIAEALLVIGDGLVQIGGLGTKGNRPVLYKSPWIGDVHAR